MSYHITYLIWNQILIVVRKYYIDISTDASGKSTNYGIHGYTMQIPELPKYSFR